MDDTRSDRDRTVRVHITQDDFGYWMMSLERDDGQLALAADAFQFADHLIHDAYHPEEAELPPDAEFLISEPAIRLREGEPNWTRTGPRRAREPYYVVQCGRRMG